MNEIVFSKNPMTNSSECYVCVLCDVTKLSDKMEMDKIFAPGMVVAVTTEKELPVYPDLDAIVQDTIEATFNPDIDKTFHFDLGDVDQLFIFKAMLLGDATHTANPTVFTAKACLIGEALDMPPIRTEIKLKAAKFGKTLLEGQKSAREKQKETEKSNIDISSIMDKFNLGGMMNGEMPDMSKINESLNNAIEDKSDNTETPNS